MTVRVQYQDHIDKIDQLPMTSRICFDSAGTSTVRSDSDWNKGATAFAHHFSTTRPRTAKDSAMRCVKATRRAMEKAAVYGTHDCDNMPPTMCRVPPALVPHAKSFNSVGYGNSNVPCSSLKLNLGDSGRNNHGEVECLPPFTLARNTLQCVSRGNPVWQCGQFVADAACVSPSCGMSPELPNCRGPQRKESWGPQGTVTLECHQGHVTQSGLTQFNTSC